MEDIDLNDADEEIISALEQGRNLPANLADDLGYSRQYIQNRLTRLREHGIVDNIGRGVYELAEDPRDQTESPT
jgi:biotin operon repressor